MTVWLVNVGTICPSFQITCPGLPFCTARMPRRMLFRVMITPLNQRPLGTIPWVEGILPGQRWRATPRGLCHRQLPRPRCTCSPARLRASDARLGRRGQTETARREVRYSLRPLESSLSVWGRIPKNPARPCNPSTC
jgi:hypothetical protein